MRSLISAIGFMLLMAATSSAQLLGDPNAKAVDKPADKPVPGRPAADAKRNADNNRPGNGVPAAPRANAMFAAIDADSDGVISKVELRKAIKALRTLDTDSDGSITLAEASVGDRPGGPLGEDPQIAQLMANDKDNNGKLTADEVPQQLIPMLQGVDQNNDRAIDRNELQTAFAMQNRFGGGPWRGPAGPAAGAGNENEATGQFLRYDRDGNGRLTNDELPAPASRALQGADTDNDGAIDAGELQAALAKMGSRARGLRGGVDPGAPRGRGNDVRDRKRPADAE
jgi:Ca2+-binding EF-hand superfamily protein